MANTNGPAIANLRSAPSKLADAKDAGSPILCDMDTVEFTPTADGDTLLISQLSVDSKIIAVECAFDDLASTSCTLNLGFYQTDDDITIVDEDALATAVDVGTAAVAMTDYRFEAADINTSGQSVWELAGLSAKPTNYGNLYLAWTVAAVSGAQAGTVSWRVYYTR
jgi:hypothetical protein